MADPSFGIQIAENFDNIIDILSKYNLELQLQSYFDFLGDFIKTHFLNFTQDNLQTFLKSLQLRIEKEIKVQSSMSTKGKTLKVN